MALTDDQKDRLKVAMRRLDFGRLRQAVSRAKQDYDLMVGEGSNVEEAVYQIVRYMVSSGQDESLAKGVLETVPTDPDLQRLSGELWPAGGGGGGVPHFERHWLRGLPFIDRTQLRGYLGSLAAGDGRRVLVVRGTAGAGKTYSWNLIQHVVDAVGHRRAFVEIDKMDRMPPDVVAADIAAQFGSDPDALRRRAPTRRPRGS